MRGSQDNQRVNGAPGGPWGAPSGTPGTPNSPNELLAELDNGFQYEQAGNLSGARMAFERVLQHAPEHPYAHHRLATIADREQRFQDADRHYRAALLQTPGNSDILCDLGYSYLLRDRYEESEGALLEALRYNGNHREAKYNLGTLYGRRGNFEQALAWFRESTGNEADAQVALSQATRGGMGPAPTWNQQGAPGNPFVASAAPPIPSQTAQPQTARNAQSEREVVEAPSRKSLADNPEMNEATRKIAKDMERLKEQQEQARLKAQQAVARVPQPSAGPGQIQQVQAPPSDRARMTQQQREAAALAVLQKNNNELAQMNQRLNAIDSEGEPDLTRANQPARVAAPPVRSHSPIVQQQGTGDYGGQTIQIPTRDPAPNLGVAPLAAARHANSQNASAGPATGPAINPGASNSYAGAASASPQMNTLEDVYRASAQLAFNAGPSQPFAVSNQQAPPAGASPPAASQLSGGGQSYQGQQPQGQSFQGQSYQNSMIADQYAQNQFVQNTPPQYQSVTSTSVTPPRPTQTAAAPSTQYTPAHYQGVPQDQGNSQYTSAAQAAPIFQGDPHFQGPATQNVFPQSATRSLSGMDRGGEVRQEVRPQGPSNSSPNLNGPTINPGPIGAKLSAPVDAIQAPDWNSPDTSTPPSPLQWSGLQRQEAAAPVIRQAAVPSTQGAVYGADAISPMPVSPLTVPQDFSAAPQSNAGRQLQQPSNGLIQPPPFPRRP